MGSEEEEADSNDLDSSELGTKAYWDNYYQRDLDSDGIGSTKTLEPFQLDSWFDDVGAPQKVADYLISPDFPLFSQNPTNTGGYLPLILDLGTGNGSSLISLALGDGIKARMVGVDYSEPSISLARQLWTSMFEQHMLLHAGTVASIEFAVFDLIYDDPRTQSWWPENCGTDRHSKKADGFDLILDKAVNGTERKAFETYPAKVANMLRPGGFLLITSCNWTEEEIVKRFTTGEMQEAFEVFHKIKYPVYRFGGQQGQGVASICFRRNG